jgi:NADPH-dependent 2,4-dienoyl-CoA reductase/sulfur reductase-like enzyme
VRILTETKVTGIEPTRVIVERVGSGEPNAIPADVVALAVGWRPRGESFASRLPGYEVMLIGDALHPADFVAALQSGAAAGLAV